MIVRELLISFGIVADTAEIDAFDKRVDSAKESMKKAGEYASKSRDQIRELVRAFAEGAIAVVGFTGALVANSVETATEALAFERQAAALGLTTDAYQEIRATLGQFGVDQRDVADLFAQIAQQSKAAQAGGTNVAAAFQSIGVSMADLQGKDPEALFYAVAEGLSKTTDSTTRLSTASTLLGEDLTKKTLPLLIKGRKGIDDLRKSARDLGMIMSKDDLAAAHKFTTGLATLKLAAQGIKNEIGISLIPVLTELTDGVIDYLRANRKAISAGIESFARRVAVGFRAVRDAVREADAVVRTRLGGWVHVLVRAAEAVGVLVAAWSAFKVGSALYYGLAAIEATVSAVAVLFGVAFSTAAIAIAAVLVYVVEIAAAFGVLYLVLDDVLTLFRGGDSVIGSFLDTMRAAGGVQGEFARNVDAVIRIIRDLITIAGEVVDWFGVEIPAAFDLAISKALELRHAFDEITGPIGRFFESLSSGYAMYVLSHFAGMLETVAGNLERIAGTSGPTIANTSPIDLGATTINGLGPTAGPRAYAQAMRPNAPSAGGSSTVSNSQTIGGNTYQITASDPQATVAAIAAYDAAQKRAAIDGFAGSDQ